VGQKRKDKDKTGKLVDNMDEGNGPASRNNRLRKFVERLKKR